MSMFKKKINEFPTPYTCKNAVKKGGVETKLSMILMGFGNIVHGQITRLEYSTLVYLASNPGIVLTRTQIFEAVWNMESESCQSSVANVIYNLRKKIEPDSRKPIYIKTVLGMGYKFASGE